MRPEWVRAPVPCSVRRPSSDQADPLFDVALPHQGPALQLAAEAQPLRQLVCLRQREHLGGDRVDALDLALVQEDHSG